MKAILQLLFVIGSASAALAQTQIVVPGGLADTEGNSSSSGPFATGSARFQQIYSASEFASLGAPNGLITGMSFRLDNSVDQRHLGSWDISIALLTTSQSPDGLNPTFSVNTGPDATLVLSRRIGWLATPSSGSETQPFLIRIPFTTPFLYSPQQGNLEVDMFMVGTGSFLLDAHLEFNDGVGRVFADSALATTGTVDSLGLITSFDIVPIPEPSGILLALISVSLFILTGHIWPKTNQVTKS